MSVIQMAQVIKQIHPEYVVIYKIGAFCNTFGKDSYIISSNFNYELKSTKDISTCGFSNKSIKKVMSKLEDKKINYLIIDPRNNYDVYLKILFFPLYSLFQETKSPSENVILTKVV